MTADAKTLRREPLNLGVAFSVVFHAVLIAYLLYMVHPHVSFLTPPATNMPTVELSPPAPPAPPKPKTALPKPVPPQAQTPQADQLQAKSDNAPPAETAPPVPSESAPPRVVGTVVPQSYFSALESLIQKSLQYPARSVANDEEGGCTVRVTFARDGMIESTQMAKASGYGALDGECREVFKRIGQFPPVPSDTSPSSTDFTIELPISFNLQ